MNAQQIGRDSREKIPSLSRKIKKSDCVGLSLMSLQILIESNVAESEKGSFLSWER
jgi:hypothetical protein